MYSLCASQIQTSYSVPYVGSFYRALASGNSLLTVDVFLSEPLTAANISAFAPVSQFITGTGKGSAFFAEHYAKARNLFCQGDEHGAQLQQVYMGVALAYLKENDMRTMAAAVRAMLNVSRSSMFPGVDNETGVSISDALSRRVEREELEGKRRSTHARMCSDDELLWCLKRHLGTRLSFVANELDMRNSTHLYQFIRRAKEENQKVAEAMELWKLQEEIPKRLIDIKGFNPSVPPVRYDAAVALVQGVDGMVYRGVMTAKDRDELLRFADERGYSNIILPSMPCDYCLCVTSVWQTLRGIH